MGEVKQKKPRCAVCGAVIFSGRLCLECEAEVSRREAVMLPLSAKVAMRKF